LIFPIRPYRPKVLAPSLRGSTVRYKPVLALTVIGPGGQDIVEALVDSGADDVVFPIRVANTIGVNLSAAFVGQAQGLGGNQPVGLLYAPVVLLLSDGTQACQWRAVVGFTQTPMRFALFGIAGGLEHFRATLDVHDRELILLPKLSLPAATIP